MQLLFKHFPIITKIRRSTNDISIFGTGVFERVTKNRGKGV